MRASFYILFAGFLIGVSARSFFVFDLPTLSAFLLVGLCVFVTACFISEGKIYLQVAFFIFFFLLGILRTEQEFLRFAAGRVFADETAFEGSGVIIAEPDIRDTNTILYVQLATSTSDSAVRIRVKVPNHTPHAYGETVFMRGILHIPRSFETETGRVFNYGGYLMKENVHYELRDALVESEEAFQNNSYVARLFGMKHAWLRSINNNLHEPQASLAGGIIVGAKQSLGEKWLDAFRDTGVIHIVVLSGYNLTLVANTIVRSTSALPQAVRFAFGSFGIVSFAIMVGANATVLRASSMAVLGMLAATVERPYGLTRALFVAGLAMVFWNPFLLMFDTGFQLSFVATLGLILLSPTFESYVHWIPEAFGLRGIVAATFATQLAVLPLLLFQVGSVSFVAPIVNLLVLPVVPAAMLFGFLAGVIGVWNTLFAFPFFFLSDLLLSYVLHVVELFSLVPFSAVSVDILPWWSLILLYAPFLLWYGWHRIFYARIHQLTGKR